MVSLGGFAGGVAGGAVINILIKAVDQFTGTADKIGARMKKLGTAGIIAGGAIAAGLTIATTKAVEAQETFNKFDVVFSDVGSSAEATAKDLVDNFGLASVTAKKLLSDTGDLLTGFGFTGEAALDLARQTNQLAVDLASFTNIEGGAERASRALTKALLGERESVKELGIAILESDVKVALAEKGLDNLTGTALKQARAQVTLEIAVSQSRLAIGDYARTSQSAANQSKLLQQRFLDLQITVGTVLIPIFEKVVAAISFVVGAFNNLTAGQQTVIVVIAALSAGVLILGGAIALLIPVVGALTAISLPWLLIILAVIAAIAGIIAIIINWGKIMDFFKLKIQKIGIVLKAFGVSTQIVWEQIRLAFAKMANFVVQGFEDMVNRVIKSLNRIIEGINRIPGIKIPLIPKLDLGRFKIDTSVMEQKIQSLNMEAVGLAKEFQAIELAEQGALPEPEMAMAGGTVNNITIETLQGLDPDEVANALQIKLSEGIRTV